MVAALGRTSPAVDFQFGQGSNFSARWRHRCLFAKVREIYSLYEASDKLGLQITEGPHKDTQELRIAAFRWMNRFLKK